MHRNRKICPAAATASAALTILTAILFGAVLSLSGCQKSAAAAPGQSVRYSSFRDVPGITDDEIKAIEAFQKSNTSFVYGTTPSTESFRTVNGEIRGFTALLCEWLTEFFGIPFTPEIHSWGDLVAGLESGRIDFTGELTANDERRKTYLMTDAIAERSIKYFRLEKSIPLQEIAASRPLRYAFLKGTTTVNFVHSKIDPTITYESVFIDDTSLAYDLLKSGEVDAFFNEGPGEVIFIDCHDVVARDFFPLFFEPVSLSAQSPALRPIISVVQKVLHNEGTRYLTELYNQGYHDYIKHKLFVRLTYEELAYIHDHPVVKFAAEHDNYPISFYNANEKEWQGIVFDVLKQVEELTGIKFERINDLHVEWPMILRMLENGEVPMVSELIRSEGREGRFLWPDTAVLTNNYALLSKTDKRNININEILYVKVGLIKDTAHGAMFKSWFPNHVNTVEYETVDTAFLALERDEVDMVMARESRLLDLLNYRELVGYKANVVFDDSIDATLGLNKNEVILCSILNKSLQLVDTRGIAGEWTRKTYDYRAKMVRSQRPWLISAAGLLMVVLILLSIFFLRKQNEGKRLEILVQKRTVELVNLQNDLKAAVDIAETASKSKSRFLANMSHEMRTPLNAIIGLSELELGSSDLKEESFTNIEKIYSAGISLLGIINDLLDISKIESGKFTLIPVVYDVSSMINDTVNLNVVRIGSKPIEFRLHVDGTLPCRLEGDELRIKQIFNNLLSNAIKYTNSGNIDWTISCVREGIRVRVTSTVKDTGKGIKEEDLKKLFQEDYFKTDVKANYYVEGTGLGLPITMSMVKQMGGFVKVESEYQKGSTFIVEFYQEAAGDEVIGNEAATNLSQFRYSVQRRSRNQQLIRSDMSYATVLVVDDVVTNLDVARSMLKLYNLNVECVTSGQESINRIREEKVHYDAVFMDHMMPGMDGVEAVRIIRNEINSEYAKTVPIIALTANAIVGNEEMFMGKGFQAFLSKPIDVLRLDQILHQWVRNKKKEKEMLSSQKEAVATNGESKEKDNELFGKIENLGINPATTLVRFGNDMDAYLRILQSFVTHAPEFIANAKASFGSAAATNDLDAYRIAVHSIKGSGRGIGAEKLGDMAEKLEFAAKQGDAAFIEANNGAFIEAAEKFIASVSAFLQEIPSNEQQDSAKPEKDAPDPNILAAIKKAAENYDMGALQTALKDLDAFHYRSQPELAQILKERANKSDFKGIQEKLNV